MNYLESKLVPQDIFTVIGRFLSHESLIKLSKTKNPSFSKDSQVYKELLTQSYPLILKHYRVDNYKETLEKIHHHDSFIDYACVEGLTPLLEDQIPSSSAMQQAYQNNHKDTIQYLHEKHFKLYEDDKYYTKVLETEYGCYAILVCLLSMFCTVFIFASVLYVSRGYHLENEDISFLVNVLFELAPIIGGISMTLFICTCLFYQRRSKPWLRGDV